MKIPPVKAELFRAVRETDGRIILRWIFRKWNVGVRTGCSWLKVTTGGGQYVSR